MSLLYPNRYPGRWDPTSAAYPQGKFRNRSSPTAKDGSFCEMDWANDWAGFFGAILNNAGVVPNGSIDTAQSSQLYNALIGGIVKTAGRRDVGTGAGQIPTMDDWQFVGNAAAGQIKFPNGWRLQWVTSSQIANATSGSVAWVYPFPSLCLTVIASPVGVSWNANAGNLVAGNVSTTGVDLHNWGPISATARVWGIGR